ncbi:MAG: FUN14 domain-containing protein [Planctomycetota bacterium]|nr:FUN14 domain-containing protein [Planctomycetota bacterium]
MTDAPPPKASRHSLFGSTWLAVAIGLTLLAGGWWAFTSLHAEPAGGTGRAAGASGFASAPAATGTPSPSASEASLAAYAPTAFAIGLSFVGAYFVGYVVRKVIKLAVILAVLVVVGLFALRAAGVISFELGGMEQEAQEALEQAQAWSERAKEALATVLPSGVSGTLGLIVGARRA